MARERIRSGRKIESVKELLSDKRSTIWSMIDYHSKTPIPEERLLKELQLIIDEMRRPKYLAILEYMKLIEIQEYKQFIAHIERQIKLIPKGESRDFKKYE